MLRGNTAVQQSDSTDTTEGFFSTHGLPDLSIGRTEQVSAVFLIASAPEGQGRTEVGNLPAACGDPDPPKR